MKKYQQNVLTSIEKNACKVAGRNFCPVMKTNMGDVIITDGHRIVVTSEEVTGYSLDSIKRTFEMPLPSLYGYEQKSALPSVETLREFHREMKKAKNLNNHLRCWPLWNGAGYTFIDSKYLLDALVLMPSAETAFLTDKSPYRPIYIDSFDGFEMYLCPVRLSPEMAVEALANAERYGADLHEHSAAA